MKFDDFYSSLRSFAPLSLSDRLCEKEGLTDNSGIIIQPEEEFDGVLFALDLTSGAVEKAAEEGIGLIVTHHPAIFRGIKSIERNSPLFECVKRGIGVVSFHLNTDCAERGTDYWFAQGLGAKNCDIIEDFGDGTGYGRVFAVEGVKAKEILSRYKKNFSTDKVWLYGDEDRTITKIATFCGAGLDENEVSKAVERGADMVASADVKHHVLLAALNAGLAVLSCTHYATENYGMKKICGIFAEKFKDEKIIFFDDERLV
ncbi:MAG: Nif3-like dinuclear metal center hexameric protein [Clostridia bacterium]|nr:Nif3-like dinuclear metal center hexameric protein [Clostridia bacterium]